MLLKEFPDINRIRKLRNLHTQSEHAWQNVALNIKCHEVERTGIESPYSLFINLQGNSMCRVNKQEYKIGTGNYLFTLPGEQYNLFIDNRAGTEICNLHINKFFFEDCVRSLTYNDEQLLNNKQTDIPRFFTGTFQKDERFFQLINNIKSGTEPLDIVLQQVVEHMVMENDEIRRKVAALPFTRTPVKLDIQKRLSLACDLIHDNYKEAINLDAICTEIGMSKFHFLRVFKKYSGTTPHQYINKIRMEKAAALLRTTNSPISDIAIESGFEYANSFIKAFRKQYIVSPLEYRKN